MSLDRRLRMQNISKARGFIADLKKLCRGHIAKARQISKNDPEHARFVRLAFSCRTGVQGLRRYCLRLQAKLDAAPKGGRRKGGRE